MSDPAAAAPAAPKDSFKTRTISVVKGKYEPYMRRSLQSLVLYEANRCLEQRYAQLRPFQRKFALHATASELLQDLGFLDFYQRQEIMFRTIASKEPLAPDLAWRRMKLITREIGASILTPAYRAVLASDEHADKSHDERCDLLLQLMYDDSREGDTASKPHHKEWEFSHNNVFTVYRMYYKGADLDPDIFPAVPPKMVPVPLRKPPNFRLSASAIGINPHPAMAVDLNDEERRAILKEVKDHTELLASFAGIIPDDELLKRKRRLYAALPPVPLPVAGPGMGLVPYERKRRRRRNKAEMEAAAAAKAATAAEGGEEAPAAAAAEEEEGGEEPVKEEEAPAGEEAPAAEAPEEEAFEDAQEDVVV